MGSDGDQPEVKLLRNALLLPKVTIATSEQMMLVILDGFAVSFYFQIWFDENLKWNRYKNPGVSSLTVSTDKIWMPDIVLHTK